MSISCMCDNLALFDEAESRYSLHIVPGSQARLNSICINNDNMLLTYANARARLWNAKTKEFWRSMALDKVEEMLSQGGWTEV